MSIHYKFSCKNDSRDYIELDSEESTIVISGAYDGDYISFHLDKSTAIKFAKTLRTEINKIKEVSDVKT